MTAQPPSLALHAILLEAFHGDVAACNGSEDDAVRWCNRLLRHYGEPQRHYHTVAHLTSMLQCTATHGTSISSALPLRLAIYFHDIVYDPRRHDNEAESIGVFNQFARDIKLDPSIHATAQHYIGCTVSHTVPAESVNDVTLQYFLDFDLEVLSRPTEAYDVYATQIALEYAHLSRDVYRTGRCAVLRKFLQRDTLYFTAAFRSAHEEQARRNIERELGKLSSTV